MKRGYTIIIICFALCAALLAGCGGTAAPTSGEAQPLRVVCTVFPLWDWTRNVLGGDAGDVELTLLLGSGVDLHSFQPGVDDMVTLSRCDLLIYVGGESDDWIADALSESVNPKQRALNLLEILGEDAFAEELREGMIGEAEEDAADEHIWLSPRRAALLTRAIADALCALDEAHAAQYEANAAKYLDELDGLEADCAALAAADKLPLLVADRFPFRYLAEDCGLDYYAAFSGCSAETGASFETVAFLAGKTDEYDLPAIYVTESPISGVAEAVQRACQSASPEIVTLDSMQSVTRAEAESVSYVDMMKSNLEKIKLIVN